MMRNFEINSSEIDKIKKISEKEKKFRIKNLEFFIKTIKRWFFWWRKEKK